MKNRFVHIFNTGILAVCLYFNKDALDQTLVPRFLLLSIFIFGFFWIFIRKNKGLQTEISIPEISLLCFSVFSVLSIGWAINPALSIVESSKIFLYLIVLFLVVQLFEQNKKNTLILILKYVLILFFISILFFFYQLVDIKHFNRTELYLIKGISGHKNLYSIFIYMCSIFSLIGIFLLKKYWKHTSYLALFIQVSIVFFLQTRSVWIAYIVFILTLGLIIILKHIIKKLSLKLTTLLILLTLILVNLGLINILPMALTHYQSILPKDLNIEKVSDQSTLIERVLVWQKTYEISKNHKLFGLGANNWQICFPSSSLPEVYPVQSLNVTFQRPHNDFLWILSEYGIIGFNLYFFTIVFICFYLFRRIIVSSNYPSITILSGIVGYFSLSFFDFPRERIEINLLLVILLGIAIYLAKMGYPNFKKIKFKISSCFSIFVLLVLSFIIMVAVLNYRGEFYTKKMYAERFKNNNGKVISFCNSAQSFCYNVDPTTVPIKWYSGNAYANINNIPKAYEDFQESNLVHPYNHLVLNDLGSVYYRLNNIDSAIYFYTKSIDINYRYDEPKLNLMVLYMNNENYYKAREIEKTIYNNSERRAYYNKIIEQNAH